MDINTISFIICVNDPLLLRNSTIFIQNLIVPTNYEIEIITVFDSESIAAGYNKGMKLAKGKYKVYLHQDVYITNPNFIQEILNIFRNSEVGIIGVVGTKELNEDRVWWLSSKACGMVFEIRNSHLGLLGFQPISKEYDEVLVVDGLLMVTQYDITWREDIFDGWHFYDSSQCMEFIKSGKLVVIPKQMVPWCIHDCGVVSMDNFDYYRRVFKKEYADLLNSYNVN